jgi:Ca2+-binding RTX toxin-like protein
MSRCPSRRRTVDAARRPACLVTRKGTTLSSICKRILIVAAAVAASVAASVATSAGVAHAAAGTTVAHVGNQLVITAATGKANDIFVRRAPAPFPPTILVRDRGDVVSPGAGCQSAGSEVQCSAVGVFSVVVNAGDGNDRVVLNLPVSNATINGGPGSDILSDANNVTNDTMNGGDGDDKLFGAFAGFNHLFGDAGNDTIFGGDASDSIRGGTGNDTLSGRGGNDELRGDADFDNLNGGDGFDDLCIGEVETNCEA